MEYTQEQKAAAAKAAHEFNRAYCAAIGEPLPPSWDEAGEAQHRSVLSGVDSVIAGNTDPAKNHENFLRTKLADGWTWGPVKDEAKKQHPLLIPYQQMPKSQQTKNTNFIVVVQRMLSAFEA